jgi:hypothetical protein
MLELGDHGGLAGLTPEEAVQVDRNRRGVAKARALAELKDRLDAGGPLASIPAPLRALVRSGELAGSRGDVLHLTKVAFSIYLDADAGADIDRALRAMIRDGWDPVLLPARDIFVEWAHDPDFANFRRKALRAAPVFVRKKVADTEEALGHVTDILRNGSEAGRLSAADKVLRVNGAYNDAVEHHHVVELNEVLQEIDDEEKAGHLEPELDPNDTEPDTGDADESGWADPEEDDYDDE